MGYTESWYIQNIQSERQCFLADSTDPVHFKENIQMICYQFYRIFTCWLLSMHPTYFLAYEI